jgi:SAM-dependent methyltransferase
LGKRAEERNGGGWLKSDEISDAFDECYYAVGCGRPYKRDQEWLSFFDGIASRIVRDIAPESVLDVGCAMGFLVEALRDRGVDARGMDISEYAIGKVREDIKDYCWVGSIAKPLEDTYDLIVTIETFEHLSSHDADIAVQNIVNSSNDILFSSSASDYNEPTHKNVQPPDYWAELFARHEYFHDIDYDLTYITDWAMRFRKSQDPVSRMVAAYERKLWKLSQQSKAERELIIRQRNTQVRREKALDQLQIELDKIVSSIKENPSKSVLEALENIAEMIDRVEKAGDPDSS